MLKDCLEIFSEELRRVEKETGDGDRLVLDTYVPADGTYVLVDSYGQVRSYTIKMDKKKELWNKIQRTEKRERKFVSMIITAVL